MITITGAQLHTVNEVLNKIKRSLLAKKPLSLIRLGNGEALLLAHGILVPVQDIPVWIEYAGVKLPNEHARQRLLQAVMEADIVGVTTDFSNWDCAPLLERVFNIFHLKPRYLTYADINWQIHRYDRFYRIVGSAPAVIVGRLAEHAAPLLKQKGMNIVNTVPLNGFDELEQAEKTILSGPRFRVAIVAAGIPAAILCPRLSRVTGCLAVDFGHALNDLITPGFDINKLAQVTHHWLTENCH